MSTRIRLRKIGRKKLPLYRIVVADKESPRDGRFIEILGTYDPKQEGAKKVVIDVDKAKDWLAKGATADRYGRGAAQVGRRLCPPRPDGRGGDAPPRGGAAPQTAWPEGRLCGLPADRRPGAGVCAGPTTSG